MFVVAITNQVAPKASSSGKVMVAFVCICESKDVFFFATFESALIAAPVDVSVARRNLGGVAS